MNLIEKICTQLRWHPLFRRLSFFWSILRPGYDFVIHLIGRNGLSRCINNSDSIRVTARLRHIPEIYEPEVWRHLIAHVEEGDTFVDVGAYIGLYSIAAAKRVGNQGHVYAVEPDRENFSFLTENIRLNALSSRIQTFSLAITARDGFVPFVSGGKSTSRISTNHTQKTIQVPARRLDTLFRGRRIDILKIDVEGYEEEVLISGENILKNPSAGPRLIYIEVHPYAWKELPVSADSLLKLLSDYGYDAFDLKGERVDDIVSYGEIVAKKRSAKGS